MHSARRILLGAHLHNFSVWVLSWDTLFFQAIGVCPDEYTWRSPACRSNSSRCIVYFTGGNGWGVDIIMQQAIAWNMPTAIAVAKDWSSFSALPLAVKSTFYWWVPDPTFLDLAPIEIIFPAYDRNAYAAGDFRTNPSDLEIAKGTSKDLFTLAPRVENFLVNMEIDMTTLNNILLEQKTTGDSWENVTCKWLQNNEATWSSWLPDDTTCFAGFGLVDIESGEFVMDRAIKEGKRCRSAKCQRVIQGHRFGSMGRTKETSFEHPVDMTREGAKDGDVAGAVHAFLLKPGRITVFFSLNTVFEVFLQRLAERVQHDAGARHAPVAPIPNNLWTPWA